MIEDSAIPVRPRNPPTVQITAADVRRAVGELLKAGILLETGDGYGLHCMDMTAGSLETVAARLCDLLGLKETPCDPSSP